MKSTHLRDSYELDLPGVWAGAYRTTRSQEDSWSWYRDGDPRVMGFPHITVTTARWETQPHTGDWVGFHVSVPIQNGTKNARLNYAINNGMVTLNNVTRTGFTEQALAEAEKIYGNKDTLALLLDFARCFYSVATSYSNVPMQSRLRNWINIQG